MKKNRRKAGEMKPGRAKAKILLVLRTCLLGLFAVVISQAFYPAQVHAGGGPDTPDSYTVGRYYVQSQALSTTTSGTYQPKLTLTFTPPVNANYLILLDSVLVSSANNSQTQARLWDGTTDLGSSIFKGKAANSSESFTMHKIVSLTGGVSVTYIVEYKCLSTLAEIEDVTLCAIELSSNYTAVSEANRTTLSTSYVDIPTTPCTLTFTPSAGDYLIIASADVSNSNAEMRTLTRLYYDTGSASWGENYYSPRVAADYGNFFTMRMVALTAASHTFKMQFCTTSADGTAGIRNARISAIKVSDLGSVQYAEQTLNSTMTNQTLTPVAAATLGPFTPKLSHAWIMLSGFMKEANNQRFVYSYEVHDSSTVDTHEYMPDDPLAWQTTGHSDFWLVTNASHTYYNKFSTSNIDTLASFINGRILWAKMDTLESFSDVGHATKSDSFTASGAIVYMWANGQTTAGPYAVAYYDASGAKKYTESGRTASDTGQVTSQYQPSTGTAGTWHAALFDTSVGSPPETWAAVPAAAGFICSDSFTVEGSAIPEFPTVFAAIGVSGLCFAIYYWMRKRSLTAVEA